MKKNKVKDKNKKDFILVRGARVNNLKNIDVDIPKNKFVVVTGLSGSGKSSLAFDTIFVEGNRRYVEGMSSYARSFLDVSSKPDVDSIENLSPPISIDQKSVVRSPRSTVGTLTEIYDYLRILFANIGEPHCPICGALLQKKSNKDILLNVKKMPDKTMLFILAPYNKKEKNIIENLNHISQLGYARVRIDEKILTIDEAFSMIKERETSFEVDIVIDRIVLNLKNLDEERIMDSIETAMRVGGGSMKIAVDNKDISAYNRDFVCGDCGVKIKEITPRHFSFNNPEGACSECSGLGVKMKISPELVISNKKLSLAEGAIKPWGSIKGRNGNSGQGMQLLEKISKKIGFSLHVPVNKLSKKHLDIILYGDDGLEFDGVIGMMEDKYRNTKSDHARTEIERYMTSETCPVCEGKRLKSEFVNIFIDNKSIDDWVSMDIESLIEYLKEFKSKNLGNKVVSALVNEIFSRLLILENVGLGYLSLSRGTQTISGGESQRIRLATQIKSKLTGIIYVLDEPSIGLHSRDNKRLIDTIKSLRDRENSLIVVEHDRDFIKEADWIIDMGKGAGEEGGEVVFSGQLSKMLKSKTETSLYLTEKKKVFERKIKRKKSDKFIEIIGATEHNLKNVSVEIPLERMVVICGVSGSGKSTLVNDILARVLNKYFYNSKAQPGQHKMVKGLKNINKVVNVTQAPIGKTPRSNAATYTGVFSHIRELFAQVEEAQTRNYSASRFSFNMKGGRCDVCQGDGKKKIEMHLLPDMYVECEACEGTRYNKKTLEIEYQGANIAEVLEMSVSYASRFFKKHNLIYEKLKIMEDVGLGYLKLGQSAVELSGGEAQRIKLATELARKSSGKTLYILDEPTVGLHFDDIKKLLNVCDALVEKGNSVLIVEHNTDVIKGADWVIELGPDGGKDGGKIIFEGSPEKLKSKKNSPTGKFL
ncbi:MAG: UvrABC system protein A [Candidatus Moranbacteria bacterium GW2011_GWF2_34_56]|nr:MAG: UvrABC system protein A [Candidatus Moranbacteria bacterium GW2011_GWF1_34_10]KKP64788.1 MAG: UvrABC system protein A [Candidatus Moranbacteria bacterium GW2011_GWF2_34_56]HBI16854.1 excinuclease ABC subunit UvrA [Candidatus Moranbacteria bacterium]